MAESPTGAIPCEANCPKWTVVGKCRRQWQARWSFSRPRAYELCAASEVMADLSGIPDIRVLSENEAQANPLTRLKTATHRKQAWRMALKRALQNGRPVTARDAEEAVNLLSETIEPTPVNGVPIFKSSESIRAAYADPPYVGMARRCYGCPEVDHEGLIQRLETFDAWALSLSSPSLRQVLPLCPDGVRVGAWVKPWCAFRPNVNPAYAWEPVIFKLGRQRTRQQLTIRDWHIRTDAGGFFGFGEHDGPKLDNFEGRFAQLLPPKRPGAEARCRQEPGPCVRRQDDVAKARGSSSIWALIYEPAVVLSAKRC
jgi:hypothetical protein